MKKKKFLKSDFLLPRNNFDIGMGSVFNINGNYFIYNTSESDLEADYKAMMSDWQNVAGDIKSSMNLFTSKLNLNDKEEKKGECEPA